MHVVVSELQPAVKTCVCIDTFERKSLKLLVYEGIHTHTLFWLDKCEQQACTLAHLCCVHSATLFGVCF